MRNTVDDKMGVKASGGMESAERLLHIVNAGAVKIGSSSVFYIIENWENKI